MKCNILAPIIHEMKELSFSERTLANKARLSRSTLRRILSVDKNTTLYSLEKLASFLGHSLSIIFSNSKGASEYSTVATGVNIHRDGFSSWKVHLMNMVDEFRTSRDPLLIVLAPPSSLDKKIKALMASTVLYLCEELDMSAPGWAREDYFLKTPWFVSGMESLKAASLIESPWCFRKNNIFVLANFLDRV